MSSLVTEALASAGTLAKDDWSTKISKLSSRAFEVKQELYNFTEQCYIDFVPLLLSSEQINSKLSTIKSEVNDLQMSLDTMVKSQIKDSTKEFEHLSKEHAKTIQLVEMLEKLNWIHSNLTDHNTNLKSKNLYQAAAILFKIEEYLNSLDGNILVETKIYMALQTDFIVKKENLFYTLDETWKECISIAYEKEGEAEVKLLINFGNPNHEIDGQNLIFAMNQSGLLMNRMKKFSKAIMDKFIKPCLLNPSFEIRTEEKFTAELTATHDNETGGEAKKHSAPDVIFAKLRTILEFLHDHLFRYQLSPQNDDGQCLMSVFRSLVAEEFLSLIVDQCLVKSVPDTKEDLLNYKTIEKEVEDFEGLLQKIGFLSNDSLSSLSQFVSDIHLHFANRRCTVVLAKARALMKTEIHDMALIESNKFGDVPENLIAKLQNEKSSTKSELVVEAISRILKPSKPMDDNTLCLPKFRISQSVKKLVDLVYETLHEATSSSVECALRLVATAENVIELFAAVVPVYHKESLTSLPQVSALHYNDCWYIAHHLLTIGHQFTHHLPTKETGVPLTFVHQIPMIRQLGNDCFLRQMKRQRDILLECLSPLKKFSTHPNTDKYKMAEKPVKQVALQLSHLRDVWYDVLPFNVMQTSLCALVDCAAAETISSICVLEDISSDDSTQFSNVCRLMQDKLTLIFNYEQSETPWQREVRKWHRLSELIILLDSNLRSIVDRWSDGKGPLATAFTVVEVKGLIRALFQNTDQRANAISKIRY